MYEKIPWTEQENNLLKEKYCTSSSKEIDNLFPNRSHFAIVIQAGKLNLKKEFVETRIGSLLPLLEDTNESYYWAGFIAADGCINKHSRLTVVLSIKDFEHLKIVNGIK